jgi:hypothetical protein
MGCCITGYSDVLPLDIVLTESFIRHELPVESPDMSCSWSLILWMIIMEKALSGVHVATYSVVAPRELLTMTSRYVTSMVN